MNIKLRSGRRLCVHKFDVTNLKLLKNLTNSRKLDAYESIFLFKNKKKRMMNDEQQAFGNIQSPLFKLLYPDQSKISIIDYISFRAFAPPEVND
jgi:hypothetical protein